MIKISSLIAIDKNIVSDLDITVGNAVANKDY